jgi:hypothetical protein
MAIIIVRKEALGIVERAAAQLSECRTAGEVRRIKAIAMAVATSERGKEIEVDARIIVNEAMARIGELTAAMKGPSPRVSGAAGGRGNKKAVTGGNTLLQTRTDALADDGLTRKVAAECEAIAAAKQSGALDVYHEACRKAHKPPSVKAAVRLAPAKASRHPAKAKPLLREVCHHCGGTGFEPTENRDATERQA